ncbi:DUF362 domain-containing protein [Chloroflexota bacterium]
MNKVKVSIVRADGYDLDPLCSAIERVLEPIGGLGAVVKPGDRVFVKINHLSPASEAEKGIVTHPVFVEAVLELLKRTGAEITVGDDIGIEVEDGFRISGIRQMCERAGVRLVNLKETGFVETDCQGIALEKVYVSSTVLEADVIINLPKLKTHSLTTYTGAVKNMYGIIPQGNRQSYHFQYMNIEDFSRMLVDVFSTAVPHLTIMDGIVAMEGEGPSDGKLRTLGVVLASQDGVALDAIATRMVGGKPLDILTTRFCHERGLGTGDLDDIEVVGEGLEDVAVSDFKLPASAAAALTKRVPGFIRRPLERQLVVKPVVLKKQCTLCLECVNVCPTSAAREKGDRAEIDRHICIGCMCCHEVCRFHAIRPTQPIAGRVINSVVSVLRRLWARVT